MIKNFNLNAIEELVNTQYNDMKGVSAIDFQGSVTAIYDLCKDKGINIDNKFIVGFGLSDFDIEYADAPSKPLITCKILYLDKIKYGASFDEIKAKIFKQGLNNLSVDEIRLEVKYIDLIKYIKSLDILFISDILGFVTKINTNEV